MVNKLKSVLIAAAIAAAFFVMPASKASAQVAFQAQVNTPIGTFGVGNAPGPYYGPPAPYYAPPAYAPYTYPYSYPYPVSRFWVVAPYPHWVYRRAYYGHPYAHGYGYGHGHSYHRH